MLYILLWAILWILQTAINSKSDESSMFSRTILISSTHTDEARRKAENQVKY